MKKLSDYAQQAIDSAHERKRIISYQKEIAKGLARHIKTTLGKNLKKGK